MTICTSGDNYSNHNIATNAYEWFNRYTPLEFKQKEIEVLIYGPQRTSHGRDLFGSTVFVGTLG